MTQTALSETPAPLMLLSYDVSAINRSAALEGGSPHLRSRGCRARFSRAVHPPRRRRLDRTICIPSSAATRRGTRRRATRSWGHGDDGERLHPANRNRIVPASRATATGRAIMKRGGSRLRQHVYGGCRKG